MRLRTAGRQACRSTYVFDVWAGLDGDHVAVLDPEVVANDPVNAGAPIVELLVSEDNENGVTPLLSTDKHGVATEELEGLHRSLGQRNDGVVIVSSVGHPVCRYRLAGDDRAGKTRGKDEHKLVGLLLLLEDSGGSVIFLHRKVSTTCLGKLVEARLHEHP